MTKEENKDVPRRFFTAFETNDSEELERVLSPDFKFNQTGSMEATGREELLQKISGYQTIFSDQKYTILDQVAEGDLVVNRVIWEATHVGDFLGLPPTGKRVLVSGISIERIKDGRIVERWLEMDQMSLLQQLGLVPPT
jgi:steroid delta-isomerase-like uncharacterized protein